MVPPDMIRDEDPQDHRATEDEADPLSKVPQVTLAFWVVKILATTLGETGGDALSMTLKLGYAESTLIFLAFFLHPLRPGQVQALSPGLLLAEHWCSQG